jgi:uncharacterized protein YbaP (TraB family)
MRRGLLFALTLVLAAAVMAGPGTGTNEDPCFLWRVSSGDRSVYLLGSIHFMKKDAYPLNPTIEDAFEHSGVLVFETEIDKLDGAAVALVAAGTLEGDRTLADVVPAELYRSVATRLDDLGMDIGGFEKMKPWMVALSLTTVELMRAGYLGAEGVDAYFSSRAKAAGKITEGLESIEFQVSLFADMSAEESVEFLQVTMVELDTMIPIVEEITAAWQVGDAARIEALLTDGFDGHDELYDRLVTQRNLRWLPRIEALFEGPADAMVVVGSLHLVGEKGLIELLKAKGYKVEQL